LMERIARTLMCSVAPRVFFIMGMLQNLDWMAQRQPVCPLEQYRTEDSGFESPGTTWIEMVLMPVLLPQARQSHRLYDVLLNFARNVVDPASCRLTLSVLERFSHMFGSNALADCHVRKCTGCAQTAMDG